MVRIPVFPAHHNDKDDLDLLRNYYRAWRDTSSVRSAPFFQLFKEFMESDHLKELEDGAIKLYLYYGFFANNDTGESWHSVERIAEYFGVQTRTVEKWNRSLKEAGLIHREKDRRKSNSTFLIPFSGTIRKIRPRNVHRLDDQALVDDLLQLIGSQAGVFGPIIKVIHLFHWGYKNKKPTAEDTANQLLIITKRNDILTGHLYTFHRSAAYGINTLQLPGEVCSFESCFSYEGRAIPGLAVSHTFRLLRDKAIAAHHNLMIEIADADPDELLTAHPRVKYGLIDVILEEEEDSEEDEEEGEST